MSFWGTNPPPQLHNYWVSIKKVNQILKLKCCESSYTFVSHDRGWTIVNGSLNADFYYSDWLYLVEKGNLKMVESIFNSIEVSDDSNHNNKFIKSYKMAVSFKLSNAEFPPLLFLSTLSLFHPSLLHYQLLLLASLFLAILLIGHLS